jgi:hypothetical protein
MFGEPVVTCLRAFIFARKAAGASRTRHSLRPLFSRGKSIATARKHVLRGKARVCVWNRDIYTSTIVMPGLDPGIHQTS